MSEGTTQVFAAVGSELRRFRLDDASGDLHPVDTLVLPARIQYAWRHPRLPILYAACADRDPEATGERFMLCAIAVGAEPMRLHGRPAPLPSRAINCTVDPAGRFVLSAFSEPAGVTVHLIEAGGTLGKEVAQRDALDVGVYPHQVRVAPSGEQVIVVARGYSGLTAQEATPGTLRVFAIDDAGLLSPLQTVALADTSGIDRFNPRHLDFHPYLPLIYLALEAQNQLVVLPFVDGVLGEQPIAVRSLLMVPPQPTQRQLGGAIRVHPDGRHVYVANRADAPHEPPSYRTPTPPPVFEGDEENTVVAFELDEAGMPTVVGRTFSRGFGARCFDLDARGEKLVIGNLMPTIVPTVDGVERVPASLVVFDVEPEGRLRLARCHEIDVGTEMVWWMGVA